MINNYISSGTKASQRDDFFSNLSRHTFSSKSKVKKVQSKEEDKDSEVSVNSEHVDWEDTPIISVAQDLHMIEASTPQAVCKSISIQEIPGSMTTKSKIPSIPEKGETFDSVYEQEKAEISIEEFKDDPAFNIQV